VIPTSERRREGGTDRIETTCNHEKAEEVKAKSHKKTPFDTKKKFMSLIV
jgi:hypothetical protein